MDLSDLFNKDLSLNASATSEDNRFIIHPSRYDKLLTKTSPDHPRQEKPSKPSKSKKLDKKSDKKDSKSSFDKRIFLTLKRTNDFFNSILDSVKCYRPELGSSLEKVYLTYNKIFEAILESAHTVIKKKEEEIIQVKKEHELHISAKLKEFQEIQQNLQKAKNLNQGLETQLRMNGIIESTLTREVEELRNILNYDQMYTHMFTSNVDKDKSDDNEGEKVNKNELNQEIGLKVRLEELYTMEQEIDKEHKLVDEELKEMHKNLTQIANASTTTSRAVQTEMAWVKVDIDPEAVNLVPVNPLSYYCLIKAAEGTVVQQIKPRVNDGVKWSLTPTILKFLSGNPNRKSMPYPYAYFKKLLQEICIERLSINPDICGYMQSPLPLDEYICLFFLKKNHLRRVAQGKVVEFLSSLKFHTKWQRVQIFGRVAGISSDLFDNTDYLYADYHTQMYYIFCIGVLNTNEFQFEGPEGHTWLSSDKEEVLSLQAMPWVGKADLRKIRKDVSYMTRIVVDPNGNEVECVDEDQLLGYYIKEFVSMRQSRLEKLQKNFIKLDQIQKGSYNYDEFRFLIPGLEELQLPDSLILRAFYYSSVSNPTSSDITLNTFSAACIRLGIDNPCVFAQVGWDLIFPLPMVKYMVDGKEDKYSGLILKKEKALAERAPFLRVPSKANTSSKPDSSGSAIGLEKVTALLAQHYAIIREIKKVSENFKLIVQQKESQEMLNAGLERLNSVLNSACDFFTFPIIF